VHDPLAPLRIVCLDDPALDRDAMDLDAYKRTRDYALVKTREGARAVVFTLRPLTPSWVALTLDDPAMHAAQTVAVALRAAVTAVDLRDGTTLRPDPAKLEQPVHGVALAGAEWYDRIVSAAGVGWRRAIEVAGVANMRARLAEGDAFPL
jgi:hypothetical protein